MPSTISDADHTVTCAACGRPAAGPAALVRRTVTVLFIDIVGFTSLVDDLEPEDVRELQLDYFAVVARIVRAHGGVVEKYVGDAVMAVFGVGAPGEPFATRAVQAGLRMQRELDGRPLAGRFPVRTRVGIATGDVVVDPAAADGGQAMVSGRVVTTAARLQAYAPHGTTVVCANTRDATATQVAYQDLPPVAAPGKPRPLELWRALPPDPRPAPAVVRPRPVRLTLR
jgi:class 3 adenylate cyclase